ncbi:hypothetical protein BDI4_700066 [Burkholderia diffusa]|nr:hypothetical protein BDI4_700066 [Burkholderia diffusa]
MVEAKAFRHSLKSPARPMALGI